MLRSQRTRKKLFAMMFSTLGFPKPSQSVFEPHSLVCVESLTFICDGINWHPKYSPRGRVSLRFAPIKNAKEIHHVWPHR